MGSHGECQIGVGENAGQRFRRCEGYRVKRAVKEAAFERVKKEMGACVSNAADKAAKEKCVSENAKKAAASAMGVSESEVDATQVSRLLKEAAVREVADEMDACTEGQADSSVLKNCRTENVRLALARTLGKDS